MKKPSLVTLVSVAVNVYLSLWLINNYFYDEPFRNYVNITFGQIYPFLVLTIGLGGGSGLGYYFLKRRYPEQSAAAKLQKARPLRQGTLPASESGSSPQNKGLGSIASIMQATKHTAYAVPPLAKGSTPPPSSQRSAPSVSWSANARPASPGSPVIQRPDTVSFGPSQSSTESSSQIMNPEPAKPSSLTGLSSPRLVQPQFASRVSQEPSTEVPPTSQWRPEQSPFPERKVETSGPYPKPGLELSKRTDASFPGQAPRQGSQPSPPYPPTKWQPPGSSSRPGQWVDPVPKQGFSPSQKWLPPSRPGPGGQPPVSGGVPMRPGPLPPQRSPFAQSQPPPRPLAFPGAMRPPEGGPSGGPRPFRPDQSRPLQSGVPPPRPTMPGQRPGPSQWARPGSDNRPSTGTVPQEKQTTSPPVPETQPSATSESKSSSDSTPVGEMDWDTALDTILKTLRKDKVVEK